MPALALLFTSAAHREGLLGGAAECATTMQATVETKMLNYISMVDSTLPVCISARVNVEYLQQTVVK